LPFAATIPLSGRVLGWDRTTKRKNATDGERERPSRSILVAAQFVAATGRRHDGRPRRSRQTSDLAIC
jgi:hypothetical protein